MVVIPLIAVDGTAAAAAAAVAAAAAAASRVDGRGSAGCGAGGGVTRNDVSCCERWSTLARLLRASYHCNIPF